MTRDKDFKTLVRRRMRETGTNYTSARAELLGDAGVPDDSPSERTDAAWRRARDEHHKILGRFLGDGRLVSFPARRKVRVHVLLHLVGLFDPRGRYSETQINQLLGQVVDDHAFWRRELVNYGYLCREAGQYWLPDRAPERPAHMEQEIPDWEGLWLPRFLAGRA
ncbi:hypothetical protein GCM10027030_01970 [Luteococcus sediminum]